MALFYVLATPIGNLQDISKRALRILSGADLILCEDTRVTKKLLERFQIKTPLLSYHQHSKIQKIDYIINLLKQGKNLVLVSDAGTPGISDPGHKLIARILESIELASLQVKILPVPGPSAVTAAASIAGFSTDKFLFLGFLPAKKKRKKFFEEIAGSEYPVIFYESPHRIIKTLKELSFLISDRKVIVCRELTKKFETIYRGTASRALEQLEQDKIKGEFVIVVGSKLKNKQQNNNKNNC